MIKVVQFDIDTDPAYKIDSLEQLNEYLQQNEQAIDLIEIQKHPDSYLLIYRLITDENRDLIVKRG